jgi:hypothetical protein
MPFCARMRAQAFPMEPEAPRTAIVCLLKSISNRCAAYSIPINAVAAVKVLPVVTAISRLFATVIPASPTTDVNAPRPTILAPWSAALRPAEMMRLMTLASGSFSIMSLGVSGTLTNQPSALAPLSDCTPVICEVVNAGTNGRTLSIT